MANKIYDVIPPESQKNEAFLETKIKIRRPAPAPKKVEEPEIEKPVLIKEKPQGKKPKKIAKKIFFALALVAVLSASIYSAGLISKVKVLVKVWPKVDNVSVKKSIISDPGISQIDYLKTALPGQVLTKEKAEILEFKTTGKAVKEIKAKGTIKIYNNFSEAEQSLVAGTRFISSDGKLFKLVNKTTVPGGHFEKSKLVAGEIDAEVEAAETGESYNISPSTFSIPGFAGTPKYTSFFAKSFSNMTGGFKGETAVATQDDINKAEASVLENAKTSGLESFKNEVPKDFIFSKESAIQKVKSKKISAKAGDPTDKLIAETEIETSAVIIKYFDAEEFAKKIISENIPSGNKIKDGSLKITLLFKSNNFSEDADDKKLLGANFDFSAEAQAYPEINLDEFKKSLLGRSFQDLKTYLADNPEKVYKIEISPGLFWRKTMPNDESKVNLEFKLDR